VLTILTGGIVTILDWGDGATALRYAGLATLVAFISVTLAGTVPINKAVLRWDPSDPPHDWRQLIRRWERQRADVPCARGIRTTTSGHCAGAHRWLITGANWATFRPQARKRGICWGY
jgi:hypothetical protein